MATPRGPGRRSVVRIPGASIMKQNILVTAALTCGVLLVLAGSGNAQDPGADGPRHQV